MRSYLGRSATKWLGCGVLAISAAACASDKTPAKEPVAMGEMTAPGPQTPEGRRESDTTIAISEDFRRECRLPNAPKDAPHFDYADATLHTRGASSISPRNQRAMSIWWMPWLPRSPLPCAHCQCQS